MFLTKTRVPARLRDSEFADSLPLVELRRLDEIGTVVDITQGHRIIEQSTIGRECFIIVDGEFAITRPGVEVTVSAGDVAGELALLTGRPRNASVTATADGAAYALHPREFATLLSNAPTLRSQVVATAQARLDNQPVTLPAQFVRRTP